MCKWKSKQVYGFFQIWMLIWIISQFTSTKFKTMFWIVSIFSIAEDNRKKKKTLIPFKLTNYDSFPVFQLHIMSRISVEVKNHLLNAKLVCLQCLFTNWSLCERSPQIFLFSVLDYTLPNEKGNTVHQNIFLSSMFLNIHLQRKMK